MNDQEKESLKNEILIEVNEKIQNLKEFFTLKNTEQDERINKLCYISETQSKNLDKVLNFMEEEKNKPNKASERNKGLLVGALISVSVFLVEKILSKFIK